MVKTSSVARLGRIGAAAMLLVAGLGSGISHAATPKAPVSLTFWSWVPNIQDEVNLFNQSHPDIKVNLVNAGQGAAQYLKLRTALKANSGAPDVVQIEYQYLPTFELTGKLADLSKYGANAVKKDFVSWTWDSVSVGTKVYAIPQDSGPMALLYRADIFAKYHLAVPTTWAQYAQEAVALHKANPKIYMTEWAANDGGWLNALLWQVGARPFKVNGTNLTINVNSAPANKLVNYWGGLVKAGVVSTLPDFNTAWYTGLADGSIASWVTAGWGPGFLSGQAAKTIGLWRAAPMLQWTAGAHASSNWGGSTDAVTTESANPAAATEFAIWLNDNAKSTGLLASGTYSQYLFPTTTATLNSAAFQAPVAFYGGQKVNGIFATASKNVDLGYQYSPFQDYVYTQLTNALADATAGKVTFSGALMNVQNTLVSYAKSQGFTVN